VVILRQTTVGGYRVAHGTGWVLRADGLIVTNAHVADLDGLEAVFTDGATLPVEGLVVDDPEHDLAVLKVTSSQLVPLSLSDVAEPTEGSSVYVVGNPLGFDFSVAQGLVAAYRRSGLPKDLQTDEPDRGAVLQLEVTSGAGGSGSPVLDEAGRVIGVIRAGVGRSGGTMVFAVPVEYVRALATPARLAGGPRSNRTHLWVNLAISIGIFLGGVLFFRRLNRGSGPKRPVRKWSGYEE